MNKIKIKNKPSPIYQTLTLLYCIVETVDTINVKYLEHSILLTGNYNQLPDAVWKCKISPMRKINNPAAGKFSKLVVAQRTSTGNLVHSCGAADRNALEPIVTQGSTKTRESMEHRQQSGT